jgi:hypothetical protein
MKRPVGVTLIALVVLGATLFAAARVVSHPPRHAGSKVIPVTVALSLLALLAAEALWSLRPRAFLAFTLWSLCGIAYLVMTRLPLASSGHGIRLMGPIASAGLAYALVALYLRRAV